MRLPSAAVVSNAISPKPGYRLARALNTFDFEAVQAVSKAQVMALASGDAWLNNGANLLLFGPPGGGKSQLAAALGFALVGNLRRVLSTSGGLASILTT